LRERAIQINVRRRVGDFLGDARFFLSSTTLVLLPEA